MTQAPGRQAKRSVPWGGAQQCLSSEAMISSIPRWKKFILTQGCSQIQVAYGADGKPSKALAGFCKKNGVLVEEVTREEDGKGVEYVWAVRHQHGLPAAQVQHP